VVCTYPGEGFHPDMATTRFELRLRGSLAHTVLDVIRARFDRVGAPNPDGTVLIIENVDQAAVRALLTLLWDTGHEVLSLTPLSDAT
jgi:hypothetical protein